MDPDLLATTLAARGTFWDETLAPLSRGSARMKLSAAVTSSNCSSPANAKIG